MAFGPRMRLDVNDLTIELSPLTKESMREFVEGMQQMNVIKYLSRSTAPTLEDEHEWYDKVRGDTTRLIWGIWVIDGNQRIIIGNTELFDITRQHIHQATSGSMIFRQDYWRKGIASAIHQARTWYAFEHMGLHRVMSAVIHGNIASRKALEKSGYSLVYVERNTAFVDGGMHHQDNLAALNPRETFWMQWWQGDHPTKRCIAARERTQSAIDWAKQHVKLT